jgi:hypothetical protein
MHKDKYQLSKCSGHQRQVLNGHLTKLTIVHISNIKKKPKHTIRTTYFTVSLICSFIFHLLTIALKFLFDIVFHILLSRKCFFKDGLKLLKCMWKYIGIMHSSIYAIYYSHYVICDHLLAARNKVTLYSLFWVSEWMILHLYLKV